MDLNQCQYRKDYNDVKFIDKDNDSMVEMPDKKGGSKYFLKGVSDFYFIRSLYGGYKGTKKCAPIDFIGDQEFQQIKAKAKDNGAPSSHWKAGRSFYLHRGTLYVDPTKVSWSELKNKFPHLVRGKVWNGAAKMKAHQKQKTFYQYAVKIAQEEYIQHIRNNTKSSQPTNMVHANEEEDKKCYDKMDIDHEESDEEAEEIVIKQQKKDLDELVVVQEQQKMVYNGPRKIRTHQEKKNLSQKIQSVVIMDEEEDANEEEEEKCYHDMDTMDMNIDIEEEDEEENEESVVVQEQQQKDANLNELKEVNHQLKIQNKKLKQENIKQHQAISALRDREHKQRTKELAAEKPKISSKPKRRNKKKSRAVMPVTPVQTPKGDLSIVTDAMVKMKNRTVFKGKKVDKLPQNFKQQLLGKGIKVKDLRKFHKRTTGVSITYTSFIGAAKSIMMNSKSYLIDRENAQTDI